MVNNKEKVLLLSRAKNDGISIQKVFRILIPYLGKMQDISEVSMKLPGLGIKQILTNIIVALKSRNKAAVIHITGAIHYLAYFLKKNRTITTVHDLGMITNCNRGGLRGIILKFLFVNSLKRNRCIICISQSTKNELLSLLNYPDNQISVIPDPISDDYSFFQKEFNKECPRILHIGTKANKNLERTIIAIKGLTVHLHIIGKLDERLIKLLSENGISYSNGVNISEDKLIEEYRKCDIMSFISTYEGFGMPIIEAQSIGRVCITSDIEPMNSVCGEGGAYLVDPFSVESIRHGYMTILSNRELREKIISAGLKNAKKYKAETIAEEYSKIYKKIADENSSFGTS